MLGVFGTACELPVEPPARDTEPLSAADPWELTQGDLNRIAQGLARALGSELLRRELVADLRSSPYEQYSLDFNRYISSNSLLPNALRAELPDDVVDRILSSGDQVELLIPNALHRATWEATDDIVVFGEIELSETLVLSDLLALSRHVYRTDGSSFDWKFGDQMGGPYVKIGTLGTRQTSFVPRERNTFALSDKGHRRTISDVDSEFQSNFNPNIETAVSWMATAGEEEHCGTDLDPHPTDLCLPPEDTRPKPLFGKVLPSGRTYYDCVYNLRVDRDGDGFDDGCEYEIADAWRPRLLFDPQEQHKGRYEHWAVKRSGEGLRVFYALAYYYDPGRWVLGRRYTDHDGDSEWIVLDVSDVNSLFDGRWETRWIIRRICLSAHWTAGLGADATSCRDVAGRSDRPKVWISRGKHGNYFTRDECNQGGLRGFRDVCTQSWSGPTEDFNVVENRNLSYVGYTIYPVQHNGLTEWMWDRREFCGWRNWSDTCSGGYGLSLAAWGWSTLSGVSG